MYTYEGVGEDGTVLLNRLALAACADSVRESVIQAVVRASDGQIHADDVQRVRLELGGVPLSIGAQLGCRSSSDKTQSGCRGNW